MNDVLRCDECQQPVRMIQVMRGYLRLGHVQQPPTLHPVRLSPASSDGQSAVPVVSAHRGPSERGSGDRSETRGSAPAAAPVLASASTRTGADAPTTYPRLTRDRKGTESAGALASSVEGRTASDVGATPPSRLRRPALSAGRALADSGG